MFLVILSSRPPTLTGAFSLMFNLAPWEKQASSVWYLSLFHFFPSYVKLEAHTHVSHLRGSLNSLLEGLVRRMPESEDESAAWAVCASSGKRVCSVFRYLYQYRDHDPRTTAWPSGEERVNELLANPFQIYAFESAMHLPVVSVLTRSDSGVN